MCHHFLYHNMKYGILVFQYQISFLVILMIKLSIIGEKGLYMESNTFGTKISVPVL